MEQPPLCKWIIRNHLDSALLVIAGGYGDLGAYKRAVENA